MSIPQQLKIRVVSMPCWELFDEQDGEYQDSVLLSNHDNILRIYVEKAATKNTGHDKYAHFSVVMPSYGLSGKGADVEKKLEFTPEFIAAKVWGVWTNRGRSLPQAGDEGDVVQRLGCHDLAAVFRLCCSTRCALQFRYLNFKTLLLFFTRGKEDLFHGLVFVSPSSSLFNRVQNQIGFIGHRIFFVMLLTSNS